jgi:hypothetical protein
MTKSAYHHGNLAEVLVEATLKLIEQDGTEAVSLRDLATAVTACAPIVRRPRRCCWRRPKNPIGCC